MPLINGIWKYTEDDIVAPTYSEHLNKLGDSVRNALAPDDTGWFTVALVPGYTALEPFQVRRIGEVAYWRGRVHRDAANFPATDAVITLTGAVPAEFCPPNVHDSQRSIQGVGHGRGGVSSDGRVTIVMDAATSRSVWVGGMSGYLVA